MESRHEGPSDGREREVRSDGPKLPDDLTASQPAGSGTSARSGPRLTPRAHEQDPHDLEDGVESKVRGAGEGPDEHDDRPVPKCLVLGVVDAMLAYDRGSRGVICCCVHIYFMFAAKYRVVRANISYMRLSGIQNSRKVVISLLCVNVC